MKTSKRTLPLILLFGAALITVGIKLKRNNSQERTFVILSTNDMHAQIDKFPALATAISNCRDTVDVVLVDAGDRCTGNAFVDLVDLYAPMYELMNTLEYDVAVYGNHEFDKGQANLTKVDMQAKFPILGANIKSHNQEFPQPESYTVVDVDGLKIAFVGVVGNDVNGHPAGKDETFEGLVFENPHTTAAELSHLAEDCDMLVLVSHCGLARDEEFAASELSAGYNMVISAHSHDMANEVVGDLLVTQTGSRLKNVGATTVKIDKNGKVSLSHKIVPLADYERDAKVAKMVEGYYNNPELNAKIGEVDAAFDGVALRNLFAEVIRERMHCNIGLYHQGGVRIESIAKGDVSLATVLNAEPFGSTIAVAEMSRDDIKALIMAKFNDKKNLGEAHCIDIVTTTPYTVVTGDDGDAVDVIFPALTPNRIYKVAMGDYIFKTYQGLKYKSGSISDILITDVLEEHIKSEQVLSPDTLDRQQIIPLSQMPKADKE